MTPTGKRIRFSAVVALMGSAAMLLFGGLFLLAASLGISRANETASLMPLKPMMYVLGGLCLALSAWGTSTAIAILLRRRWARISMLVFAGLLAFGNASAMLFTLLAQLLAVFQNRPAEMAGWVAVGFTGALAALGVWWLALFNRSRSKEYFEVEEALNERARPMSISVIAWLLWIGAAFTAIVAVLRSPAMMFGIILTGWLALVVYAVLAAVQIYLGRGLLHLHEKARIAAIAYFCFGCVNIIASLVGPGYAKMMSQMQAAMSRYPSAGGPVELPSAIWFFILASVACCAVQIYFLVRRRAAFH